MLDVKKLGLLNNAPEEAAWYSLLQLVAYASVFWSRPRHFGETRGRAPVAIE